MRNILIKQFIAAAIFCGIASIAAAQVKVEKYGVKSPTAFAIITDSETLSKCAEEFHAYKQVLEEEGLGTYIISADWKGPEEVKAEILALAGKKPRLEGVVFAGDIPIVKVRQGQHLTTAFKMNEEAWPMEESSVPSDRFYDDFGLSFDFICRDTVETDVFYYRLSEEGAQHLRPDIYSARMKVPAVMKGDKYEIMRKYLRKVVDAHRQNNALDNLTFFAGHGYNSDCLTLWRQKPVVFREYFPYVFSQASHNRFLNFREDRHMKWNLLSEVARKDVDLFVFSEHGAPDTQYINESKVADNLDEDMDYLRRSLAEAYKYYAGKGHGEDFCCRFLDKSAEGFRYYDMVRWKEGKRFENEIEGMYFAPIKDGETYRVYDMDGDGKNSAMDICLYTSAKPEIDGVKTYAVKYFRGE